ncbi:hypothetical protein [Falsiroseomonas sp. HW251]|uniref:hypothetical protein n=1 Tax=Falsiroseomonas sp. HW251 TaxID=3390998 RepID=UPI003D317DB6
MSSATDCGCGCGGADPRCGGTLPDQPDCAVNYHFGLLLGVEDFRAEQGFHLGHHRRHQRLLHGWGVVHGMGVGFDAEKQEIRVEPGFAVDARGRDLSIEVAQCLGLPAWWMQNRDTDAFADIPDKDSATFDADVLLSAATCLSRPVPAIADPCAEGGGEIAFARICETAKLTLVRRPAGTPDAVPGAPSYRLLRRLAGLVPPDANDADEAWLAAGIAALGALSGAERAAAEAALWRAVAARAAAATADPVAPPVWLPPPDIDGVEDRTDCMVLARLTGVSLRLTDAGWQTDVASVSIDGRATLLPTQLLEALRPPPAAPAGPVLAEATLGAQEVTLRFDRAIAGASVTADAFAVTEFDGATGWKAFALVIGDVTDTTVALKLDRAPSGQRLRVTALGRGATPLLGADLIPAGAPTPDADGTDQSLTLPRS